MISKSAHICEGAKLGKDVTVEPFAYIAADVEIGDGCWIGPGAVILDGARLGKNCKVHTAAVVAGLPQDLKFKGEYSTAVVGDNTTIRECATISRGTAAKGVTTVGSNTLIMAYVHVGHDCTVGDNCVLVNRVSLAGEVEEALQKHAVVEHPEYGKIYAFEVDGFGSRQLMDDANVPSLLAMPYLGDVDRGDPVYENTRKFVWSGDNPYFWRGAAGEGIGGPHIGVEMIWPMSIMMRAFTSDDDAEIRDCIVALMTTDAGTGFMHESFSRHDAANFTRAWFAWQNTLFGELILKLVNEGKTDLLNSIN